MLTFTPRAVKSTSIFQIPHYKRVVWETLMALGALHQAPSSPQLPHSIGCFVLGGVVDGNSFGWHELLMSIFQKIIEIQQYYGNHVYHLERTHLIYSWLSNHIYAVNLSTLNLSIAIIMPLSRCPAIFITIRCCNRVTASAQFDFRSP